MIKSSKITDSVVPNASSESFKDFNNLLAGISSNGVNILKISCAVDSWATIILKSLLPSGSLWNKSKILFIPYSAISSPIIITWVCA